MNTTNIRLRRSLPREAVHQGTKTLQRHRTILALVLALTTSCGGNPSNARPSTNTPSPAAGNDSGARGEIEEPPSTTDRAPSGVDPLADAPWLELPGDIAKLSADIVNAASLEEAMAATRRALAKGGVATVRDGEVLVAAAPPSAAGFVDAQASLELAIEARQRSSMSSLTGVQLARMLTDFGWPAKGSSTPEESMMEFLSVWTTQALKDPSDPASVAILFIAANNQLQSPRANLAYPKQDLRNVRFSLLELELLASAFDRAAAPLTTYADTASPCPPLLRALGLSNGLARGVQSGLTSKLVSEIGRQHWGDDGAKNATRALSALRIAAKIWKLVEFMRKGILTLTLDSESPARKPLPNAAEKLGKLTAHAGVDKAEYDGYMRALGEVGSATYEAVQECTRAWGIPTITDITNVAADLDSWRVSWDITDGGGTQVQWKRGQLPKYSSRYENQLQRTSPTEGTNSVEFEIMPQLSSSEVGRERQRRARFTAQLRRGKPLEVRTLFGAGNAGYSAGHVSPGASLASVYLGLTNAGVDVASGWILEALGPKVDKIQELIEIEPKGWVGTIRLSEIGGGGEAHDYGKGEGWYGWSASVSYVTTIELGGSAVDALSTSMTGEWSTECAMSGNSAVGHDNCGEGFEVTGCDPDSNEDWQYAANWSGKGKLGDQGYVSITVYPKAQYESVVQYIPALKEKIGTWELSVVLPGCGKDQGRAFHFVDDDDQVPAKVNTNEPFPVDYSVGDLELAKGPLDRDDDLRSIVKEFSMRRRISPQAPGQGGPVDTEVLVSINLHRED
jgi:hypothetical protein